MRVSSKRAGKKKDVGAGKKQNFLFAERQSGQMNKMLKSSQSKLETTFSKIKKQAHLC